MSFELPRHDFGEDLTVFTTVATPITVEVLKDTAAERITVDRRGPFRRDVLGGGASSLRSGEPAKVFGKATPVVKKRLVDQPVRREVGKEIKENAEEREVKLVSGTIRRQYK